MPIKNRFSEMHDQICEWRRDIHAHPELLFDTVRTAGKVAGLLKGFGCDEVVEGIGRVGVVGVIKGRRNNSGRVVALRADMDALPIKEDTGIDYASENDGVMHACGHDGHTAMLLGASKYLAETRNFDGTAVVVFQPAEEGGGGGKEMVDDGLMERFGIQEIYGMHNMPTLPVGEFAIRSGSFFASADSFTIEVTGVGGHAAKPDLGRDPTLASSHIVVALQSIASRNVNPTHPVVVSVTSFQTATDTYNVIPGSAVLKGTVRAQEEEARALAEKRLGEIARTTAEAFGTEAKVTYERGYPSWSMPSASADTRSRRPDGSEPAWKPKLLWLWALKISRSCSMRVRERTYSLATGIPLSFTMPNTISTTKPYPSDARGGPKSPKAECP